MRATAAHRESVEDWPAGDVAVVSPHLDDAALSLGSTIAALTRRGRRVRVVTPYAGDPDSAAPPDEWSERCGFSSAAEAARVRRLEDARACELMGAEPVWLPFEHGDEDRVAPRLLAALDGAAIVLVPGFPCRHEDHLAAARMVLREPLAGTRVAAYVDQPYGMWRLLGEQPEVGGRRANLVSTILRRSATAAEQRPSLAPALRGLGADVPRWTAVRRGPRELAVKRRAIAAYTTQMAVFERLMPIGVALYEWQWGGEGLGWLLGSD